MLPHKRGNAHRARQSHVIRCSTIYTLLFISFLIAIWNWVILKPSQDGRSLRLPSFLKRSHYEPRIVEYTEEELPALTLATSEWASGCPEECGAGHGWGICDGVRCICHEGHGGSDCGIGLDVFYGDHHPYQNLTLRPLDLSGWDLGKHLYKYLVQRLQPNLVVEVGVWKGASAMKLAMALKEHRAGVLLAVDTWLPVLQFWQNIHELNRMQDLHFQNGYPTVFYTFISNVVQLNLTDVVIPLPATSRTAATLLCGRNQTAELIHLDASHDYESAQDDILHWWRNLRNGGILLGDDWSLVWPGVLKAVREHAGRHHLDIHVFANKWWIYKPRDAQVEPCVV